MKCFTDVCMNKNYKNIHIYSDANSDLYIIPSGENILRGGTIEIDIVHHLRSPHSDVELERIVEIAFDECYTMKPNLESKYTPIERFLGIKGWARVTADKKLVSIDWWRDRGYEIRPWRRADKPPKGHYIPINDKVIKLDNNLRQGVMATAVREAIDIASL
jgi:hypothetical protein